MRGMVVCERYGGVLEVWRCVRAMVVCESYGGV